VKLKEAEKQLADPVLYSNGQDSSKWLKEHDMLKHQLDLEMKTWEALISQQ